MDFFGREFFAVRGSAKAIGGSELGILVQEAIQVELVLRLNKLVALSLGNLFASIIQVKLLILAHFQLGPSPLLFRTFRQPHCILAAHLAPVIAPAPLVHAVLLYQPGKTLSLLLRRKLLRVRFMHFLELIPSLLAPLVIIAPHTAILVSFALMLSE